MWDYGLLGKLHSHRHAVKSRAWSHGRLKGHNFRLLPNYNHRYVHKPFRPVGGITNCIVTRPWGPDGVWRQGCRLLWGGYFCHPYFMGRYSAVLSSRGCCQYYIPLIHAVRPSECNRSRTSSPSLAALKGRAFGHQKSSSFCSSS